MEQPRAWLIVALAAVVASRSSSTPGGQIAIRLGTEFQVSSYTTSGDWYAAIASDADGDFVVAWQSHQGNEIWSDGVWSVRSRRFNSAGVMQATEFQVNSYTEFPYSSQVRRYPAIASTDSGAFTIVWTTQLNTGPFSSSFPFGLFGRRYGADGDPEGAEFQINTQFGSYQNAAIATDADDDFVVTWHSQILGFPGSSFSAILAQRFDSSGTPQATEVQVNSTGFAVSPVLAVRGDGDFVIVWGRWSAHSSKTDVFARRFDSTGTAQDAEFQVNAYTTSYQSSAAVASDEAGNFTVVWQSAGQDGSDSGVFARSFESSGVAIGAEFQVSSYTEGAQSNPAIASDIAGGFLVTWASAGQPDSSHAGVFLRRFDSVGTPLGAELHVTDMRTRPAISADGTGGFVVVSEGDGIFGQRFALVAPAVLDVDANGSVQATTDALLGLRFLFGFTGPTLTSGAVGAGCNRCDGPSIHSYLADLGTTLDVDGNTVLDALTDGVLLLRYLFGFTDTTLTAGAVGANCTRCDAVTIIDYLSQLD